MSIYNPTWSAFTYPKVNDSTLSLASSIDQATKDCTRIDYVFTNMSGRKPSLPLVLPPRKSSFTSLTESVKRQRTDTLEYPRLINEYIGTGLDSGCIDSPTIIKSNQDNFRVKIHLRMKTLFFYCPRDITLDSFRESVRKTLSSYIMPYAMDQVVETLQYMPNDDELMVNLDQQTNLT